MTRKEWGIQVKIALTQRGMTQRDLANKLGLGSQFINNLINDNATSPAMETVKRISAELGMEVPEQ